MMRRWPQMTKGTFLTLRSAETREAPGETLVKPFASHRSFYQNKVELNLKNWEDFYALAVVFCGRMLRKEVFFGII